MDKELSRLQSYGHTESDMTAVTWHTCMHSWRKDLESPRSYWEWPDSKQGLYADRPAFLGLSSWNLAATRLLSFPQKEWRDQEERSRDADLKVLQANGSAFHPLWRSPIVPVMCSELPISFLVPSLTYEQNFRWLLRNSSYMRKTKKYNQPINDTKTESISKWEMSKLKRSNHYFQRKRARTRGKHRILFKRAFREQNVVCRNKNMIEKKTQ